MSLLEDWQTQELGRLSLDVSEGPSLGFETAFGDEVNDSRGPGSPQSPSEQAIFSLELVERNVARGRGQVTGAVASNNIVAVVTSRGWFLRYDLAQGSTPVAEVELAKGPDIKATGIWSDALGSHFVIAAETHGGWESFYLHAKWKKARVLSKLKGLEVTSVAWQQKKVSETNTGEMAIGAASGVCVALSCDERERKERGGKTVLDLSTFKEPIKGLQQLPLADDRLLLLLSTPSRLYAFCGSGNLESLAAGYPAASGLSNFMELPSESRSGALAVYMPPGALRAQRFAWLAGPGLYRGALDLGSPEPPQSELDYLADHNLLPLPLSSNLEEDPISVAQTEYHELVLYKSRLQAVNRVSQNLIQDISLAGRSPGIGPGISPVGFAEDVASGALFLFTADSLIEVVPRDEDRDMWKVYLERKDFANAFRRCRSQTQRDAVNNAEATAAYDEGRHLAAAKLWGKVTSPPPSFEEIALKFVGSATPDALQTFLLTKLDALSPTDKAQATMVATWLTELYLDRINRALLEHVDHTQAEAPAVQALAQELQTFLRQRVEVLDVRTTMNLLASYGRLDDMMQYASYRKDNEAVLDYLVLRGDAKRALAILRRPDVSQELFYKFSPSLMAHAPSDTVDAWMTANPPLEPKRLLPALLRFSEEGAPPACRIEALRYVRFCLDRQQSSDTAVHQLAAALYCSEGDEAALMDYLGSARDPLGQPLYDPQTALRLARRHGQRRACVELLWELKLHEESVALALEFDMQQAVLLANRAQEDESLQRKLWLAIALHLIRTASADPNQAPGESIQKINELMREAGGLIKIEDVLPLFPDFVQIDNFKDAICQSLDDYNTQIAGLKSEMDDATRIADALRKDVAMLENRRATLDLAEPCARCGRAVGEAPLASAGPSGGAIPKYFLFPTGNAFHGSCLAQEVIALVSPQQQARIKALLTSLAKVRDGGGGQASGGTAGLSPEIVKLQAKLKAEISAEDPYNGELVIRNIDKPFILPSETDEILSWQL